MDPCLYGTLTVLGIAANAIINSHNRPDPPKIEEPKLNFQDPSQNRKKLSGQSSMPVDAGGWGSAGGFTPDHQFGQTSILTDAAKKRVLGRN